ncbi:MAG: CRISPR-associated endonuclease Cas4g/Cas1g [Thermoanaerobaculia bacterium]
MATMTALEQMGSDAVSLPLPNGDVPTLVPARMLNEFAYCPRLAYLEWSQGEWEESADTVDGSRVHRRVDTPEGPRAKFHHRSVALSSERLGLTAVVDLIETDGKRVRPIDYKRGKKPQVAGGAWEPEKVQLCAQGLLLREQGYDCHEGVLYFAGSRERVRVRFTEGLVERTLELLARMLEILRGGEIPAPLEDSPKCPRCSLVSICLPDEVNFLRNGGKVRPIGVTDRGTHPLVVQEPGSYVRLCGSRLRVMKDDAEIASVPLIALSQLVLMGGAHASSAVFRECLRAGVNILHMSGGAWLNGVTTGATHKNIELRAEQFAAARDESRRLTISRPLVAAKIQNARVLLRRNGEAEERDLEILRGFAETASRAHTLEELLGIEGSAARLYWSRFSTMLKGEEARRAFEMAGRNRRPPRDPVNALLSLAYALLTKDWVAALHGVGMDPLMGFYHRTRYGKPALALDMMEPFRPVIADSVVCGAINNGEVRDSDFFTREGGVFLAPAARARFVEAYERRMATEIAHPTFGYKCTYRRIFELEARLLGRHLLGELDELTVFRVR